LVIWCSAANLDRIRREIDDALFEQAKQQSRGCLRIQTQVDRPDVHHWLRDQESLDSAIFNNLDEDLEVSAITGEGLYELADAVRRSLAASREGTRQWLGMTAARCRESLESVVQALARAEESAGIPTIGDELIAVDVREALDHLGRILGVIYTDDILDRVFSKFCIGK
jgi:tRNA modification GTPase